jgi:hypothetical protein
MRAVKIVLLLILVLTSYVSAQLKEFEVKPEEPPKLPAVFPNYPKKAALIIHSSISTLRFSSNTGGIVDDLSRPEEGKYILILEPENQYITVKNKGFRESKIFMSALHPRDVRYYSVEEKQEIVKAQGRLILNSIPSGAAYQVVGFPISGKTPVDFQMAVGTYKIVFSKEGYGEKEIVVNVEKGKVLTKTVELPLGLEVASEEKPKKEIAAFSINEVKVVGGLINGARLEMTREGLKIIYNLSGNPKNSYEVKVRLRKHGSESFVYEPRQLSGDVGEGAFVGSGRTILWKIKEEFPGGIDTEDLYVELSAEEVGGSGWIWWTLGGATLIGGGAAYYFLVAKPAQETPSETLPPPPIRPGKAYNIGFGIKF